MSGPEELRALVEEMRATLEPLRRYYDLNDCDDRDDDDALEIPIADLRRTLTALTRAESSLASPAGMEGWMPIETAPHGETCFFWLDWADDCRHLNPPLTDPDLAFYVGKRGHWASIYKGVWWQPAPPLPAAPRGEAE